MKRLNGVFDLLVRRQEMTCLKCWVSWNAYQVCSPHLTRKFRSEGSNMEDVDVARVDEALRRLEIS